MFMPGAVQNAMKIIWTVTEASTKENVENAMETISNNLPVGL